MVAVQTADGRADMTNFEMDLFDPRFHTNAPEKDDADECCHKHSIIKPACLPVTILALLLLMVRMALLSCIFPHCSL